MFKSLLTMESLCSPQKVDQLIENTLKMTLNPDKTNLHFVQIDIDSKFFTIDLIEFNLFERLMAMAFETGDENKVVTYLYESYHRVQLEMKRHAKSNDVLEVLSKIQDLILRNISTFLKEPELLASQSMSQQFLEIFKETDVEDPTVRELFLSSCIAAAIKDSDNSMKANIKEVFHKCFDECLKVVRQASMITLEKWVITFMMAFVVDKNNSEMAMILLDYIEVPEGSDGIKYADTLLGELLKNAINYIKIYLSFFRSNFMLINNA